MVMNREHNPMYRRIQESDNDSVDWFGAKDLRNTHAAREVPRLILTRQGYLLTLEPPIALITNRVCEHEGSSCGVVTSKHPPRHWHP